MQNRCRKRTAVLIAPPLESRHRDGRLTPQSQVASQIRSGVANIVCRCALTRDAIHLCHDRVRVACGVERETGGVEDNIILGEGLLDDNRAQLRPDEQHRVAIQPVLVEAEVGIVLLD